MNKQSSMSQVMQLGLWPGVKMALAVMPSPIGISWPSLTVTTHDGSETTKGDS